MAGFGGRLVMHRKDERYFEVYLHNRETLKAFNSLRVYLNISSVLKVDIHANKIR